MDAGESPPPPAAAGGEDLPVDAPASPTRRPLRSLLLAGLGALVLLGGLLVFGSGGLLPRLHLDGLLAPDAVCGNGQLERDEECDDGNAVAEDGCLPTCRLSVCGDGV